MKIVSRCSKRVAQKLEDRATSWKSIWLCYLVQMLSGVQFSMYFTSMWPYFSQLDSDATMSFFGWINTAYSLGQMIASWVFGYWNQKTMRAKQPACFGLFIMALGNTLYAVLPEVPFQRKWLMLVARLLVGFGSAKVMALSNGSFVLGISLGPAVQAIFTPIGEEGFVLGTVLINMYTLPPMIMVPVSLVSIFLLGVFFTENYAGTISEEDKKAVRDVVEHSYETSFQILLLWFQNAIEWPHSPASIYGSCFKQSLPVLKCLTMTPLTMVLYNWNDRTAVLYNGIIHIIGCSIDVINYLILCYTPVRRVDKRKLMLFSMLCFIFYYIATSPWPFYSGSLDFIKIGTGLMQGIFEFGGCVARCIAPVILTKLFESSGYLWINVIDLTLLFIGFSLLIIFYGRIVPLNLKPNVGVATRYKRGMFYRL
ncbi:unnamed protein product [Anisakis simplex]|uniref:MFS domain-containing protein n=1 Tax=Anisakis simplex TaxID=6269 RepID=A0A0M3K7P2_ANISI|nr:unnamed protein product [Anisakis simplex]